MDNTAILTVALLIPILLYIGGAALTVLVLWMTIRSGVRKALKDHYLWVQGNQAYRLDHGTSFPPISPTPGL